MTTLDTDKRAPADETPSQRAGTPDTDARTDGPMLLAWAGWSLWIPEDWQPLKLTGTPEKGQVIVGDAQCAIFVLKWERGDSLHAREGRDWITGRLKKLGVQSDKDPPGGRHFTACGWARGVQTEEDKKTTYWFGYAEPANLLVGVTVNGVLPDDVRHTVVATVLPSLRATPVTEKSVWAMYDLSFLAPPGFTPVQRRLSSGDVALQFEKGRRETLLLRQVYPAELALNRRSHEKWLNHNPFKEHRRLRQRTVRVAPWQHKGRRPELNGVQRTGWKRLPFPLGAFAARHARAMAVHDKRLDRLLLAEHLTRAPVSHSVCSQAIQDMNVTALKRQI